jgi:hypothetical protein
VSRQTLPAWLTRYEAAGLDGLVDRSYRPVLCPHQVLAEVEAALLGWRRSRPYWGPRPLAFELAKRRVGRLCYSRVILGTPIAIGIESERKHTVAQPL